MTRTILTCAGIGDGIWLIQKLVNSGEQFNFRLAGDEPRRGHQIFELLPSLCASVAYDTDFGSSQALQTNIQLRKKKWCEIDERAFFLTANHHLEQGERIESFLPDLGTSFEIGWNTGHHAKRARELMPDGVPYVGLYGSSYSTVRSWSFWGATYWAQFAARIRGVNPDAVFVVVGASFDTDLAGDLSQMLANRGVRHLMFIGEPLGFVIEAMKRMRQFFSFPSGLGILAPTVRCPTMMFYPAHLLRMMNAWADPAAIKAGLYKGLPFCDPERAYWCATEECGLEAKLA
jgi:hypothetical protein